MIEELEKYGLTTNEAKVYLYLLQNPRTTTGPIIRDLQIANSQVYHTLQSLVAKGLSTTVETAKGKHYSASDPKALEDKEQQRLDSIRKLVPELRAIREKAEPPSTSILYEGFNGFKTAFRRIIEECPIEGTIDIIGFSEEVYNVSSLRIFLKNMNLRCNEKRQRLRVILDEKVKDTLGKDRELEEFSKVRYLPASFLGPAATDISGDDVYLFLWDKKPYVFMIRSPQIAKSYKQHFKFLWEMARSSDDLI